MRRSIMNKKLTTSVTAAMLAALTCIATMVIKVPTIGTNGYVNIGDSVVVLSNGKIPKTAAYIVSSLVAEVIMVAGYFLYEATFLGYGVAAAASIPSNMVQGITCLVLGNLLIQALSRVPYINGLMVEKR